MLKPQKKSTIRAKKDIKEDKFVGTVLEAKNYIEENYKQVLGIVVTVFAVILIIMAYSYYQGRENIQASTLFGKAQVEYQNFNYTRAKEMLTELREKFPGTEQGQQGMLFLANLYFQEKNIGEAKNLYAEFIDSYGGSNILLASGYAGYAACLETESNYSEAADFYVKAKKTAPEFVEAANYLYLAGMNYIEAGETDKATDVFETIVEDYKDSDRSFDAESQLILLAQK